MEQWIFAGFLAAAAIQDGKRKQVSVWVYLLFGAAALVSAGWRLLAGGGLRWTELAGSVSIGLCMLGAGIVTGGAIGSGDGCFFLVSGLLLGFWHNLMLLCCGTLLCGIYGLGYLVWCRWHPTEPAGKKVVPFLPFLVPPGIWLLMQGSGW